MAYSESESLSPSKRLPQIGGAYSDMDRDSDADSEMDHKISFSGAPLSGRG
jgi:hypothetical protein